MLGFSNKEELLKSKGLEFASRIKEEDLKLFLKSGKERRVFGSDKGDFLNFHVFDEKGNHVGSLLGLETWDKSSVVGADRIILDSYQISLNPKEDARKLKIIPGRYKGCYNFFNKTMWGYDIEAMFLQEISPSREEARLKLKNVSETIKKNFVLFGRIDDQELKANSNMILDFGKNLNFLVINWMIDEINDPEYPHSLLVKFYEPLPEEIEENSFCWLFQEVADSIVFPLELPIEKDESDGIVLRGPNFSVADSPYEQESDYLNYEKILPGKQETKEYLLKNYFEPEKFLESVNVDYKKFENFCFFSSAERRMEIFIQKANIIENIEKRITELSLSATSSGAILQEKIELERKKNEILVNLDDYERFLFNEKGYFIKLGGLDFDVTPPKITLTKPHKLVSTDSVQFKEWKTKILNLAKIHDATNPNLLRKYLPYHVLEDRENEHFLRFVDMIGHHFDILWLNIKSMASLYNFGSKHSEGISGEIAYFVGKSLGLNLIEGKDFVTLAEYILGNDLDNIQEKYLPYLKISREIWKRILNNISYILKTKGTAHSIRALLNCFGIPVNILKIKEFEKSQTKRRKKFWNDENFRYAINLEGSQSVTVPWLNFKNNSKPKTVQFRFKTSINSTSSVNQVLLERNGKWALQIKNYGSSSNRSLGEINFILSGSGGFASASLANVPIFNDEWWSVMLRLSSSAGWDETMPMKYELHCKQWAFDRFVFERSGSLLISGSTAKSYNDSYHATGSDETIKIGGFPSSSFGYGFVGQIQEFRLWSSALNDDSFENYARSGFSYDGNAATSSLNELIIRYSFNRAKDHFIDPIIKDSNPGKIKYNATASGFVSGSKHYNHEILRSKFSISPSGIESHANQQVEIERNHMIEQDGTIRLFWDSRTLNFNEDDNSFEKVAVYFSVNNAINEDIVAFLGEKNLGDFIGDPESFYESEYKELRRLRNEYFENRKNFASQWSSYLKILHLYDKNLFSLIHSFIPERSKKIVGIVVEQNALEAPKIKFYPVTGEGLKLDQTIVGTLLKTRSDIKEIETKIKKISQDIKTTISKTIESEIKKIITKTEGKNENDHAANADLILKKIGVDAMEENVGLLFGMAKRLSAEMMESNVLNDLKTWKTIRFIVEEMLNLELNSDRNEKITALIEQIDIFQKMNIGNVFAEEIAQMLDADAAIKWINGEIKKTYIHKWKNKKIDEFWSNLNALINSIRDFSQLKENEEIKKNKIEWWRRYVIEKKKKNFRIVEESGFSPISTIYLTNRKNLTKNKLFYEGCRQIGNEDVPREKWTTPDGIPVIKTWQTPTEKAIVSNRGSGESDSNLKID